MSNEICVPAVDFEIVDGLDLAGVFNAGDGRSRAELQIWDGVRIDSQLASREQFMETPEVQSIGQVARHVTDLEIATAWYRDVLGLAHLYSIDGLAFFDCGGVRLIFSVGAPETNSIIYFAVKDVHAAQTHLKAQGVEMISAPHMIHRHEDGTEEWMAFFKDPDGSPLGMMSKISP
ncbi:MAG: VOC family protein [Pseudomonadota bacterium]